MNRLINEGNGVYFGYNIFFTIKSPFADEVELEKIAREFMFDNFTYRKGTVHISDHSVATNYKECKQSMRKIREQYSLMKRVLRKKFGMFCIRQENFGCWSSKNAYTMGLEY